MFNSNNNEFEKKLEEEIKALLKEQEELSKNLATNAEKNLGKIVERTQPKAKLTAKDANNQKSGSFIDAISKASSGVIDMNEETKKLWEEINQMKNDFSRDLKQVKFRESINNGLLAGSVIVGVALFAGIVVDIRIQTANSDKIIQLSKELGQISQKQENLDGDFGKLETRVEKYVDRFLDLQNQFMSK